MKDDFKLSSFTSQDVAVSPLSFKPQTPNRLVWFGHIAAILPFAVLLFTWLWFGLCIYDQSANLIGPAWLVRLGGDSFVLWPIQACLIIGIACISAGLISRRVLTVWEGLWCFCAYFILMFLVSQF